MLFAVLRCMVGCMVPADIKNDHCWDLTGGGGNCASLLRVSSLRVYSDHIGVLGGCSTSVQIHPWPTDFGRIQYEHVDKWDEGGGAAPSKRRCVSGLPPHPFVYNHVVIMMLVQPLQVADGAMKLYEQVCHIRRVNRAH